MDRRAFVAGAVSVLATPLAAPAQPAKVPRIGFLGAGSPTPDIWKLIEPFRRGLRDHGYVEGQNLLVEYRWAEGRYERFELLAADLAGQKVDLIVAPGIQHAQAARRATSTIPIVTVYVGDPVGEGLAASLARPGGNVTGLSSLAGPRMGDKLVELLKEAVPTVSRVAVLWHPADPGSQVTLRGVEAGADRFGLRLQPVQWEGADRLEPAIARMGAQKVEALVVLDDPIFFAHRQRLANLTMKYRLAEVHQTREYVVAGAFMAYGTSLPDLYRRAAGYVDRILKGAKPADLPIEQPTKFELVINLNTAKKLGLTVPPSLLARADEIIQ